ncbi:MAG: glycosyltransferase [bacterium]
MNPDLSVIIVTWNSAQWIEKCLRSLAEHAQTLKQEVIVVDNASEDETAQLIRGNFGEVQLIESSENLGFAKGCNRGLDQASGKFLWLLNPDTELIGDAPALLASALQSEKEAGITGAMLLDERGLPAVSFGDFPDWRYVLSRFLPLRRFLPDSSLPQYGRIPEEGEITIREVDWISGANLFFRREVLQRVGKLHPRFFAFFEDVDFCRRARNAWLRSYLVPEAKVIHYAGRSFVAHQRPAKHIFLESELLYFRRHLPHPEWARRLFLTNASLKLIEASLTKKSKRRNSLMERRNILRLPLPSKGGFSLMPPNGDSQSTEFSIIIPLYNRAHLLPRSIQSVLEQKHVAHEKIEIIVCNDGSTDNPQEALQEALGNQLRQIPVQIRWLSLPHSGLPGRARNAGLSVAQGIIIAFLDSDDRWLPHHLQTLQRAFRRHPKLGMVITGFRFSHLIPRPDGSFMERFRKAPQSSRSIITDCVAIRRKVVEQFGGFGEEDFMEDFYYWHRLMPEIEYKRLRRKTAIFSFARGGDHLSYRFERIRSRYA